MTRKSSPSKLSVVVTKQGKRFVAYAPALDISTAGNSEENARKRFVELAHIFFEELSKAGTTNEVLTELGWHKVQNKWTPPQVISSKSVGVNIPVSA